MRVTSLPPVLKWVRQQLQAEDVIEERILQRRSCVIAFCQLVRDRVSVEIVIRVITDVDWVRREPALIRTEAAAIRIAHSRGLPVPTVLALDPTGDRAGGPTIVMSRLTGSVIPPETPTRRILMNLAGTLAAIHDLRPRDGGDGQLPPYQPHDFHLTPRRPQWATTAPWWDDAVDIYRSEAPFGTALLHRDFRPENLLFNGSRVVAILDWTHARRGVPSADVGICRLNLLLRWSRRTADRFLEAYLAITEARQEWSALWDIYAAMGMMSQFQLVGKRRAGRLGRYLEDAVSEVS